MIPVGPGTLRMLKSDETKMQHLTSQFQNSMSMRWSGQQAVVFFTDRCDVVHRVLVCWYLLVSLQTFRDQTGTVRVLSVVCTYEEYSNAAMRVRAQINNNYIIYYEGENVTDDGQTDSRYVVSSELGHQWINQCAASRTFDEDEYKRNRGIL